jgi:hypothetical protein
VLECWSAGVLECWSAGVLECWSAGVLECWSAGVTIQSIVTGSGNNDTDLFETNMRVSVSCPLKVPAPSAIGALSSRREFKSFDCDTTTELRMSSCMFVAREQ